MILQTVINSAQHILMDKVDTEKWEPTRGFQESKAQLFKKTSATGVRERLFPLMAIARWLGYSVDGDDGFLNRPDACRWAPSLISRSDAELFGISTPRFSLRVYFDAAGKSFVNLRRARTLWMNVPRDHRGFLIPTKHRLSDTPVLELVGDCFLEVPERFRSRYYVITAQLGAAYGEEKLVEDGVHGTPFVRYTDVVGICGHAVCYIASALHEHSSSVYGLTEISALLWDHHPHIFEIGGLSAKEIVAFFSVVGLRSSLQQIPISVFSSQATFTNRRLTRDEIYCDALRSYLLSNAPVIVTVDFNRINGIGARDCKTQCSTPLHDRASGNDTGFFNGDGQTIAPRAALQPKPHYVILVGCGLQNMNKSFLLHDPLTSPYLQVTCAQLVQSAPYVTMDGSATLLRIAPPSMLPVTAEAVQMPLLEDITNMQNPRVSGLVTLAFHFHFFFAEVLAQKSPLAPLGYHDFNVDFRLCKLCDVEQVISRYLERELDFIAQKHWNSEFSLLKSKIGDDWWCWLHFTPDSIWIWNAQASPPSANGSLVWTELVQLLFLAVGRTRTEEWVCWNPHMIDENKASQINHEFKGGIEQVSAKLLVPSDDDLTAQRVAESEGVERGGLELSLITSFSSEGYKDSIDAWPSLPNQANPLVSNAELYLLFQKDADELLANKGAEHRYSARELMARAARNSGAIQRCAEIIGNDFSRKNIKLRAFATYLPEVLDANDDRRFEAFEALKFAVRLARAINELGLGHRIQTIEIVAGSSTDEVRAVNDDLGGRFIVQKLRKQDAIVRLFEGRRNKGHSTVGMRASGGLLALNEELVNANISIGIELEPGPLFALNDLDGVTRFLEALHGFGSLSSHVGFNLDIGHWAFLAKIKPEIVAASGVLNHVCHCHISDHAKGHFGDATVGAIHESAFKAWLRMLYLRSKDMGNIQFSGLVSAEIECCKNAKILRATLEKSAILLDDAMKPQ